MTEINTLAIVDDDDIYQFTTKKIIEYTKQIKNIITFPNGKEIFQFLLDNAKNASELPDVILLDLNMPVMDGWGFLNKFIDIRKNLVKKIAVYVVSSSVDADDILRVKNFHEVNDFIEKPLTIEKLQSKILQQTNNKIEDHLL